MIQDFHLKTTRFSLIILCCHETLNDIRSVWNAWVDERTQHAYLPFLRRKPLYSLLPFANAKQRYLHKIEIVEENDEGNQFCRRLRSIYPGMFF
jgi:hypothetical protein